MKSIRRKISRVMLLLAGTFVLVVAQLVSVYFLSERHSQELQEVHLERLELANSLQVSFSLLLAHLESSVAAGETSWLDEDNAIVKRFRNDLRNMKAFEHLGPTGQTEVKLIEESSGQLISNTREFVEVISEEGLSSQVASGYLAKITHDRSTLQALVPGLRERTNTNYRNRVEYFQDLNNRMNLFVVFSLGLAFFVAAYIMRKTLSGMMSQLNSLGSQLETLEADNLRVIDDSEVDEELKVFASAANTLISTVNEYQSHLVEKDFVELVIDSMNDYMFVFDTHGKIKRVSRNVIEELGYSASDIEEIRADKLLLQRNRKTPALSGPELVDERMQSLDALLMRRDGACLEVLLSKGVAIKDGKIVAIICIAKDVSELKEAIDERQKLATKLSHASKMASLGTLGAGVAHELNNPLAAVRGFAQIIATKDMAPGRNIELAKKIMHASDRMGRIINHLRKFSRETSELDKSPISLVDVLKNTLMLIDKQLETRNIEVKVDYDPDLPLIYGDSMELESVFHNFFSNSKDAFHKIQGRKKSIRVHIGYDKIYNQVIITYEDNAGGIRADIVDKIFDPFFTTKDVGEGTGLGMSIVYDLVEQHGGSVELFSEEGQGVKFVVTMPALHNTSISAVYDEAQEAPKPKSPVENKLRSVAAKPRVLVVDDERMLLEVLESFLAADFELTLLSDPRAAMAVMQAQEFEIILTDFRMPGKSGVEVLEAAQKLQPAAVRILMTGQGRDEAEVANASDTVASSILSKPFEDPESVIEFIKKSYKAKGKAA